MVHNLIMTLGLSTTIVAFGCSESGGSTVGSGGSGGSGGSTLTDCTNAADTALVCADGFDAQVESCATTAVGQGPDTSTCLQGDPGLSEGCADCYGDTTQCTFDNCVLGVGGAFDGPCGPPNEPDSEGCLACRAEDCTADFDACTGAVDCGGGGAGVGGGAG